MASTAAPTPGNRKFQVFLIKKPPKLLVMGIPRPTGCVSSFCEPVPTLPSEPSPQGEPRWIREKSQHKVTIGHCYRLGSGVCASLVPVSSAGTVYFGANANSRFSRWTDWQETGTRPAESRQQRNSRHYSYGLLPTWQPPRIFKIFSGKPKRLWLKAYCRQSAPDAIVYHALTPPLS